MVANFRQLCKRDHVKIQHSHTYTPFPNQSTFACSVNACVTADLAAAFCSCLILMVSSLTGLGMNVMSAPSFTSRPIHQSLLYFCRTQKKHTLPWVSFPSKSGRDGNDRKIASNLFYVQKVFGFKINGCALDRTIFIQRATITNIGFHCKGHWFRLSRDKKKKKKE